MAEAIVTTDEDKPAVAAAGIPIKLVILIVAGTLLLGLGGTIAYMKFAGHKDDAHIEASSQTTPAGKQEETVAAKVHNANSNTPGAIYDVDPFIVNLADVPEARYLKLTLKLELDRPDVASDLGARVPQLRDTILILLSSKDAGSLRTPQGKFQLRDELIQRVNAILPKGGIRSVYFTEFVVQ